MKRGLIGFLIAIVVLAVVLLGAPGLVSGQAESALKKMLSSMSQPGLYKVELTSYEPGWFSSRATSSFAFDGELAAAYDAAMAEQGMPAEAFTITFDHDLSHGPLLMTDAGPKVALAYAETGLNLPPLVMLLLAEYLKGQPLFTLGTTFGFSGGSSTDISNPSFSETFDSGMTIRWDGINGQLVTNGGTIEYTIDAPMLRFESDDEMTRIENMNLAGKQSQYLENIWLGESQLTVPEMRFRSHMAGRVELDGLTIRSTVALDDEKRLDYGGEMRVARVDSPEAKFAESAWSFELNNLSAQAVDTAIGAYQNVIGAMADEQAARDALSRLLGEVLEPMFDGPVEMKLGLLLNMESDEATVNGNSSLALTGSNGEITVVAEQTIDALKAEAISMTDSVAKMRLTGLDGSKLSDAFREMATIVSADLPSWQQDQEISAIFESAVPRMVNQNTRLTLENLALNVPEGTAVASGSVGFSGMGPINLESPETAMARLAGKLSATISEGALLWGLSRNSLDAIRTSLVNAGRDASDAAVEDLAQTAARGQLSALEAQALVRRDGGDFVTEAEFRDGMLYVNGVPRPDLMQQ